jgi:nitric oxide reductase subunit B
VYARHWTALLLVIVVSFAILGWSGVQVYQQAPPVPERVVATDGHVIFTGDDVRAGMDAWRAVGGQELGSVWGHGGYVAPDWTAEWLHREASAVAATLAREQGAAEVDALSPDGRAVVLDTVRRTYRTNTLDPATGTITVPPERAAAIRTTAAWLDDLFGAEPALEPLRKAYAMKHDTLPEPERRRALAAFVFWTAWAASTERPGQAVTYTNNWPSEPLVDNRPTGGAVVWSVVSFVMLLAGVGALASYYATRAGHDEPNGSPVAPGSDPLLKLDPTPSMRATTKYFWVVAALLVVQVILGVLTAHYGVEGQDFYGIPLANWLPYSVVRTWHTQVGLFWIATAFLGTGLFLAPAVGGWEPPWQKAGVDFLFLALLVIVVGSLAGEWIALTTHLDPTVAFWLGHQGYEYVDLGRFWQIFLFVGLLLWLGLMLRAMLPAFRSEGRAGRSLLGLFVLSCTAIALFYGAGLMWGRHTNLAIAEYWRWWVVHLWVEGFFEVFATTAIAFLFTRMGLVKTASATGAVLFATTIFLAGGILGTLHHLYFSGTTMAVLALGAVFSALEVVPLVLVGFEAWESYRHLSTRPWVAAYRWPIFCFVAVSFWNLVGAGLFGFLINPPIALYYMQGLNTTPVHGHTALFGVYGMLAIGLMLFALKGLTAREVWKTPLLAFAFWSLNVGLMLMVLLSVLPIGLLQTWASVEHGLWWARSAEFMQQPLLQTLRWLRTVGDVIFGLGAVSLGVFVVGLKTGWTRTERLDALFAGEPTPREAK